MQSSLEQVLNQPELDLSAALRAAVAGSDINVTNSAGDTLLHRLVNVVDKSGYLTEDAKKLIVRITSQCGADANKTNKEGKTPLESYLTHTPWYSTDAAFLIRCGANPNYGRILFLHNLVVDKHEMSAAFGIRTITELVNEGKLNINHRDEYGKTALHRLLDRSTWSTRDAIFLVSCGADPKTANSQGQTLLHLLVTRGGQDGLIPEKDKKAIKQLIEKYAVSCEIKNGRGQTPLQVLMSKVSWSISDAYFLVELGADASVLSQAGESLLHHMVSSAPQIFDLAFSLASLVDRYMVDPNLKDGRNRTPLQCYLERSDWGIRGVMYLLCLGADPNTCDSKGQSLIHKFARSTTALRVPLIARIAITHLVKTFNVDPFTNNAQGLNVIEYLMGINSCVREDVEFFESLRKEHAIELTDMKSGNQVRTEEAMAAASSSRPVVLLKDPVRSKRMRQLSEEEINKIIKPLKDYAEKTTLGFNYHSYTDICLDVISFIRDVKRLPVIKIRMEYLFALFDVIGQNSIEKMLEDVEPRSIDFCKKLHRSYKNKEDSGFYRALKSALMAANQISPVLEPMKEDHRSLPTL